MLRPSLIIGVFAAGLLAAAPNPASATPYDNLAYLTFSGPVQIPGHTLYPGTYRFRLADPDSGRKVVQILSNDGEFVYAMVHTSPDYRSTVTDEAAVTFMEAPVGVAPPVKSLFYAGESNGYRLMYPKGEPNLTPPPVHPQPEVTLTPNALPTLAEPANPTPSYTSPVGSAPIASEPVSSTVDEPAALPATGSFVPLTGLGGAVSLALALAIGLLRRRVS